MPVIARAGKWLLVVMGIVCAMLMVGRQDALAEPSIRNETRLSHLMPGDDFREPQRQDGVAVEKLLFDTWKNVERKPDDLDPSRLFASFQILVNIRKYTLELYGIKDSSDKELLYTCRVGLGSAEYPTPAWLVFCDHHLRRQAVVDSASQGLGLWSTAEPFRVRRPYDALFQEDSRPRQRRPNGRGIGQYCNARSNGGYRHVPHPRNRFTVERRVEPVARVRTNAQQDSETIVRQAQTVRWHGSERQERKRIVCNAAPSGAAGPLLSARS